MTDHDNPEESLRFSIYFAIQQYRLAPPKTHDRTVQDAYYSKVADAVMKQIKLSGWTITPLRLEKHPPVSSRPVWLRWGSFADAYPQRVAPGFLFTFKLSLKAMNSIF
jgi:hypothetical protein